MGNHTHIYIYVITRTGPLYTAASHSNTNQAYAGASPITPLWCTPIYYCYSLLAATAAAAGAGATTITGGDGGVSTSAIACLW